MNNTNDRKIWMYVIVALYGVFLFRILLLRETGCYPFYYNSIQLSINGSPEKPYLEKGFSYMPFAYLFFHYMGLFSMKIARTLHHFMELFLLIITCIMFRNLALKNEKYLPFLVGITLLQISRYLHRNVCMSQINVIILFCIVACIFFYHKNNVYLSALFLACAISFKMTPGLILLYFLLKREYRVFIYTLAIIAVLNFLVPFAYWGVGDSLGIYRAWVRSLFILSGYAEQFESSTFLSFLFRYLTEYSRSWWGRYEMVNILSLSKNTVIYIYLTCSTVILLLLAKVFYVRKDELKKDIPGDKTFMKMLPDYSLIIIIMLLLSPISWQHHYVLLFIPCFYFSMYILRNGIKHDKITSALVIVPFLITGLTSPIFVGAEADRVFKAYDVFSISAFMLLAALIRIRIVSGRKSGNKQIV